jgi:hypothetical protein
MRNLNVNLKQVEVQAIINLIVSEQAKITTYGDPARYDHSDMQFFNVLEAQLIKALAEVKLADEGERKSREHPLQ